MKEIPQFNKLISITLPAGQITNDGKNKINILLYGLTNGYYRGHEDEELEWMWMTKNGGALTKRLLKKIRDVIKRNSCLASKKNEVEAVIAEIGRIAVENCSKEAETFYVDFTQNINWLPGMFKDKNSCLFGGRRSGLEAISNHGFAVRLWKEIVTTTANENDCSYLIAPKGFEPVGRCWGTRRGESYVIWNGYGVELIKMARILHYYLICEYKKISLTHQNKDSGMVYINGRTGYLLSNDSTEIKTAIDNGIDLTWPLTDKESVRCVNCNKTCKNLNCMTVTGGTAHKECAKKCICGRYYALHSFFTNNGLEFCINCKQTSAKTCLHCGSYFLSFIPKQFCKQCENLPLCKCGSIMKDNKCLKCDAYEDLLNTIKTALSNNTLTTSTTLNYNINFS